MSENTDKKLQQIIDLEIRELYDLAFFKPYLVNYIADFKPQFHQSMSDREYRDYLERKNEEAIKMGKNIAVPPTASHKFMGTKSTCTLYSRK